jgi:hypothetical protein
MIAFKFMSLGFGKDVSAVAIGLAIALGVPSLCAAQTDDERSGARAAAGAGIAAYNANHFSEAFDLLSRAESLVHAPTHLLYMARSADKLGHLVQAHELYVRISKEQLGEAAPRAFVEAQQSALKEQRAIEKRLAYLTVDIQGAPPASVKVTIDARTIPDALLGVPFPEDPGNHVILATGSRGEHSDQVQIALAEGKRERVTLNVHADGPAPVTPAAPAVTASSAGPASPNPASSSGTAALDQGNGTRSEAKWKPIVAWASIGVGAVGVGLGTVFLIQRGSKSSDADTAYDNCNPRVCTVAERDQINSLNQSASRAGTVSLISYGVGAAAISTGLYLLFTADSKQSSAKGSLHLVPYVGIGHAGATLRF